MFAPILMAQITNFHQFIGARDMVAPIYGIRGTLSVAPLDEKTLKSYEFEDFADFFMSAAPLHWCKLLAATIYCSRPHI
jgi:hypothetical protein